MRKDNLNHNDCANLIPIDVAKGFCLVHNKEILIDGEPCPKFEATAKCKNCGNFASPNEQGIGTCKGFKDEYWAFADLKTANCEGYCRR